MSHRARSQGIGVRDRMRFLKSAQVHHHPPRAVRRHLENRVCGVQEPVRTAGPRCQRIQRVADKSHVGYATYQATLRRAGLARWQIVRDGRPIAMRINFGNSRSKSSGVRADRSGDLLALTHSGS